MRIAIDTYHALYPHGGIARYIRGLVSALVRARRDETFLLFANCFREREAPWCPQEAALESVILHAPRRIMQWLWDHLDWPPVEHWTGKIDVFHGTHVVLPAVRRAKTVLTVHDLTYLRHPDYFADRALNERGYRRELPRALARADAIAAVSESTRNDLIELMHVDPACIRVVYEGVDERFFVPENDAHLPDVRRRYRLPERYLVFLVGTPEPRKNLTRAVEAARVAAPEMPLVLIGDSEKITSLLGPLATGVQLLGCVPDHDLPRILAGAFCALYPSLYEGFGLPVLEAMAAGTAVITSNVSACPEVAGSAAVCVDPRDVEAMAEAIRRLCADEALRRQLGRKGRKRAAEFSWNRAAEQMLRLYRSLV